MRQIMNEDSKKFPGITDGKTILTNMSGESEGVRGYNVKIGGTRVDLDLLCGADNERCKKQKDADGKFIIVNGKTQLALDDQGRVKWDAKDKDGNPVSLASFLKTEEGKKAAGLTGGIQGAKGTLFGFSYPAGSWQDKLVEAFSGTHDMVGGSLTGLYDEQGNAKRGRSTLERKAQDTWSASGAIVTSAPFAMAELLPADVWKAISVLLEVAK
ncbi:hypothetical protein EG834_00665 [bacterium]|nr:hypothetical protein [bacterium]